ncbi:Beta-mannosidase B [Cladobotryum mycophilum]|uniref:Beta-mannosidase B n=1 Tax=Cladobotryum mycophilum TaxID=491253 RepID=A0ABR0SCZ4_9HYPO
MAHSRVELSTGWSFREHKASPQEWLPVARVPTQVHIDLLANNKIPDPFVDLNERAVQWIGKANWEYQVSFTVPVPLSSNDGITTDIVFEGLDTFATIYLNQAKIATTENMFVSYRVNITDHIKPGVENTLSIIFDSVIDRGEELIKQHGHEHNFLVRQTEASRVPVRKAQYNWGWDWGPILMTAGPWKPVYLERYVARIDDVWARNQVSEDLKSCSGSIFARVAGSTREGDRVVVTLAKDGSPVFEKEVQVTDTGLVEIPFRIEQPELWYPLGYGAQSRYQLQARLLRTDGETAELDSQSKLIGFRRTELVQEPDAHGKSFYFRVNNVDIFAGGSCWIPADSFLAGVPAQRYRDWIKLMAEGNQVMIRIWGGGVYEDDALLDACDELGVLVWSDFAFACASYPAYPSYLQNLEPEVRQQVRRLRTHPSVVVWAGNNEDYQVQERYKLDYDFEDKDPQSWLKSTFPARYIYEHFIPTIVKEEDPYVIYHPSSPWGDGKPTADPTVGDIHQWNIWHGAMNKYQEVDNLGGRFVSEFGMIAYPHLSTTRRMTADPSQLYPGSMALDFHNKAIGHERRMMSYVVDNFRPRHDLAGYTHLTQVVQAETMRAAYKAWRRQWGKPGERRCGGVLVWQLNDCWPTMSWAVVDYFLVKKPAYYAIARALRTIDVGVSRTFHDWTQTGYWVDENSGLVTGQVDQTLPARRGTFDVWIASSSVHDVEVNLTVRFISVRSGKDVYPPITTSITASANATTEVLQNKLLPPSIPHPDDYTTPFSTTQYDPFVIHATLIDPTTSSDTPIATDTAWPDPIKYLDMPSRGLQFQVSPSKQQVVVSAERPVKGFVFEEIEGLKLSDNGFDIVPGEKHTVNVEGSLRVDELLWTYVGAPGASLEMTS